MFKTFLLILFFVIIYLKFVVKLSIDFKSLLRKGFKKRDNEYGLFAYCGKQGTGKTYSSVRFCINRKLATNCTIYTNVKSFTMFSDTIFITDINDLIDRVINDTQDLKVDESPNILIFFDEIFTVLERNSNINKKILSFISQLRKRKICFVTTAQEWLEINITFRRYVRFQVDCTAVRTPLSSTAFFINRVNDGEQLHWDNLQNEYIAPRICTNLFKGNLSIVEAYDTFETVEVGKNK